MSDRRNPATPVETVDYFGDTGTTDSWRQCRWCRAFASWPNGCQPVVVHLGNCPIPRLEAALSASGAGEDRSSETLDEWYADLVVAIPAALGMTPDPWPNTPAQIEALVREIRRAYPRVPPQEPT
jgi:hypothetical protein